MSIVASSLHAMLSCSSFHLIKPVLHNDACIHRSTYTSVIGVKVIMSIYQLL